MFFAVSTRRKPPGDKAALLRSQAANAMVIFSVLYPKSADSTFDMHYYVHTHVPLLQQLLKDFGIGKTTVLQGSDALGTPPYEAIALFEMPTEEALQQALAAHGQTLRNDVPNFTNITPVRQANGIAL